MEDRTVDQDGPKVVCIVFGISGCIVALGLFILYLIV